LKWLRWIAQYRGEIWARKPGIDYLLGKRYFPYNVQTRSGTHPGSYPMGTSGSFLGAKRLGREADYSPPFSIQVRNDEVGLKE
jgi:hypothetical protein